MWYEMQFTQYAKRSSRVIRSYLKWFEGKDHTEAELAAEVYADENDPEITEVYSTGRVKMRND